MKKLLSILLLSVVLIGCSPDNRELYDDLINKGTDESPIMYFEGKLFTGVGSYVHENGQVGFALGYKDGERDGLAKYWYENGQLESKVNYKDGEFDGFGQAWYENGQLRYEANFKNGVRDGLNRQWYENGQLEQDVNYKDGQFDGFGQAWYENGQLRKEANYKDGKLDGLVKVWYENGQLESEANYNNGVSENEDFSHFIYDFSDIIVQSTTQDFDLIFDDYLKVYHQSENRTLNSIIVGTENYFLKWTVLKDSIVSISQSVQNSYRYNYNKFYEITRKSDGKHFQYEIAGFYEINPTSGKIYKLKDETTRKINSFYDDDTKQYFLHSISDPDGYSNLRSSPYGEIIKKVYETETFNVTDTIDKHCKVIFPDGTEGYIHVSRVIQRTHPT